MKKEMTTERKMKLVIGYLPFDSLSAEAAKLQLTHRVTFVLETYRADNVDLFFDAELYAALVDGVRRIVKADRVVVHVSSEKSIELLATADFERELNSYAQGAQAPLLRVTCIRGSSVAAIVLSEPYANVGGPPPYNDSYAVPVFSFEDISDQMTVEAKVICARMHAVVDDIVYGDRTPARVGPRNRLIGTLRRLVGL